MKILHTADLHLDSPMHGLELFEGAPLDDLRLASRRALANLVDFAIDEAVDMVLIAGDVFDGDWPDYSTGAFFVREMTRLGDAGIPVVMLAGNHDAESKLTRRLRHPNAVTTLSTIRPETITFEHLGLAVHGQGFATPAVADDLSLDYPEPVPGLVNVALLHTSADGRPGHARYAPCSVSQLAGAGYDYWALGHIHAREILHAVPPVVFAGCLQGRRVSEAGAKGATLVTVDARGRIEHEHRVLDHVRWARLRVNIGSCIDLDAVCAAAADDALRGAVAEAGDRLLAARIELSGVSGARAALADTDRLRAELEIVAGGQVWLERVIDATTSPAEVSAEGRDALAELARTARALRADKTMIDALRDEFIPFVAKLPQSTRHAFDLASDDTFERLVGDAERSLMARLLEDVAR